MKRKTFVKRTIQAFALAFGLFNLIAFNQAYHFTHFSTEVKEKTRIESLGMAGKASVVFFGINNPRPENTEVPATPFETLHFHGDQDLEAWKIAVPNARGTILLFHGYTGNKSKLLPQAAFFNHLGYTTILADFRGSGGSEGNTTTVGYLEANDVKTIFDQVRAGTKDKIYLYGSSMGAAAILRAIGDLGVAPESAIVECPYGSLLEAAENRFALMGLPSFPTAQLMVFWGGIQNGFWGFSHRVWDSALRVKTPVLLLYGTNDNRVTRGEIDHIYRNLAGEKQLHIFENGYHILYPYAGQEWEETVKAYLK